MLAFGGIVAGLAWAFLIELVLDRSVKRPIEIESKLKVPLFLSIPDVNRNGHSRLAKPRNGGDCHCPTPLKLLKPRRPRASAIRLRRKTALYKWSRWSPIQLCSRFTKRCATG
jgi:hypothetical protein